MPSPATTVRRVPAAQQAQRPSRLAPASTPPPHARTAAAGNQWAGWDAGEGERGAGQADLADNEALAAAERQQLPADRQMPHAAPSSGLLTGCTAGSLPVQILPAQQHGSRAPGNGKDAGCLQGVHCLQNMDAAVMTPKLRNLHKTSSMLQILKLMDLGKLQPALHT